MIIKAYTKHAVHVKDVPEDVTKTIYKNVISHLQEISPMVTGEPYQDIGMSILSFMVFGDSEFGDSSYDDGFIQFDYKGPLDEFISNCGEFDDKITVDNFNMQLIVDALRKLTSEYGINFNFVRLYDDDMNRYDHLYHS